MPTTTITVTEAIRNFSKIIDRVHDGGEIITLTKRGKPVAQIVPVKPKKTTADLLAWFNDPNRTRLSPEEADSFARDIEAGRRMMNVPPVSKWDD